jgi:hypothetical protein
MSQGSLIQDFPSKSMAAASAQFGADESSIMTVDASGMK